MPACDWASVTLRRRRNRTETVAASSDIAREADQLQYDLDEGPCLEAAITGEPRLSNQLERLRGLAPLGADAPRRSACNALLGIQLSTNDEVLGALNLYAGTAGAFTREDIDIAEIYVTHATNALTAARISSGLRTALHSRHMIGVAQGILMQHYDLTWTSPSSCCGATRATATPSWPRWRSTSCEHRALPDSDR